ncbi:TdeIII family type II restriction endonuclease [Nitrosophilus labii]|uniref:TdeIII family type II restriction endonuclease n=1 Tax=Nitrosophilus labii TaxID=2706014 RepID=UPI001656D979|nr:TdeIII family type II restriction endonuclease [Nitrosophilus labii]
MDEIKELLKNTIRKKFEDYEKTKEPAYMPFHTALLGKDRLALYQFIHSLNTNFGTTIFEPVAVELAKNNFKIVDRQVNVNTEITEEALKEIDKIIDSLIIAKKRPNKLEEIERIKEKLFIGEKRKVKLTRVDLYCERENEIYLFDIKTAKPNKGSFLEFKRTLLKWIAAILTKYPDKKVNSLIAIPYNPYYPKLYSRWTMAGMLDLENELKVAEEFWDFLGGSGSYENLLKIFEEVGKEMREEIDEYFKRFRKE